jgi:hypothetical protein
MVPKQFSNFFNFEYTKKLFGDIFENKFECIFIYWWNEIQKYFYIDF